MTDKISRLQIDHGIYICGQKDYSDRNNLLHPALHIE